jgi:predicted SAM-dependent methyltransferase
VGERGHEGLKLHLGCAEKRLPGFVHVDIRPEVKPDHVADWLDLSFAQDHTADLIYFSHGIEHIRKPDIARALAEWHRVLKVGGVLRLAVPDSGKLVEVYQKTKDLKLIIGSLVGRQDYPENTHHMVFDYPYLSEVLQKAGFKNIHRYDWRQTIHKDYDDYSQAYIPHMDKERGIQISLNVECEK